jgi:DNA modification methylase
LQREEQPQQVNIILHGDALKRLKDLADESVDCIISSPPYFAVRDYQIDGQLGLEQVFDCTPFILRGERQGFCGECYLCKMVEICKELHRVLKKTGTMYFDLGDTFFGGGFGEDPNFFKQKQCSNLGTAEMRTSLREKRQQMRGYYKDKCLCLIPERFVTAMVDRVGFIARGKPIWLKTNGFTQSAPDRFVLDYENWYMFSKGKKYYFNKEVIRQALNTNTVERYEYAVGGLRRDMPLGISTRAGAGKVMLKTPRFGGNKHAGHNKQATYSGKQWKPSDGKKSPGSVWPHSTDPFLFEYCLKCDKLISNRETVFQCQECQFIYKPSELVQKIRPEVQMSLFEAAGEPEEIEIEPDYDTATCPECGSMRKDILCPVHKEKVHSHFAMFPEGIVDPIVKCSVPEQVCIHCGTPCYPILEPGEEYAKFLGKGWHEHANDSVAGQQQPKKMPSMTADYRIVGWTVCKCENPQYRPGVVLDPFGGWMTVPAVALQNNRQFLAIELDEKNIMAGQRRLAPLMEKASLETFTSG